METKDDSPMTCSGVIELPKIRTEPEIRRISLKTPARVRTRPLPALTRNTAATFRRNATKALLRRIKGLQAPISVFLGRGQTSPTYPTRSTS